MSFSVKGFTADRDHIFFNREQIITKLSQGQSNCQGQTCVLYDLLGVIDVFI